MILRQPYGEAVREVQRLELMQAADVPQSGVGDLAAALKVQRLQLLAALRQQLEVRVGRIVRQLQLRRIGIDGPYFGVRVSSPAEGGRHP